MTLSLSPRSSKYISGTKSGEVLQGTNGNDGISSYFGNDTLYGGLGDDSYSVRQTTDKVVEYAGQGNDTVTAYASYALSDNVENLVLGGLNGLTAVGNGLDNILIGNAGDNLIDGAAGNDLLTGGAGIDMFVVQGSDTITDFATGAGGDVLNLQHYAQFQSLAAVKAAMIQVGADVVLDLGNGDKTTLQNATVAGFTDKNLDFALDMSKMTKTFDDEFNSLSLYDGKNSGTWKTTYEWTGASAHVLNQGEQQYYVDADYTSASGTKLGIDPFKINADGTLTIEARTASAATKASIQNYGYTSGLLSSYPSFHQTYGYFEMKAELPTGSGSHPAFWMLPMDDSWPPELDIMENVGLSPNTSVGYAHTNDGGFNSTLGGEFLTPDVTGSHTYGVDWEPDTITWYVDGKAVQKVDTPSDMHKPMYMILNLAVGGKWPGNPTNPNDYKADYKIDYVRAYASANTPDAPGASQNVMTANALSADAVSAANGFMSTGVFRDNAGDVYGTSKADVITAGAHDVKLFGGAGQDVLTGGAGVSLYGGAGNDTYYVNASTTAIIEKANEGIDTADVSIATYTLPDFVENMTYVGTGNFNAYGNKYDNVINGGAGNDALSAGDGNDTVSGGDGNDLLHGGNGNDAITGGAGNNSLFGDAGDDTITGGLGNDAFNGGDGNDLLIGGGGSDTFRGGTGLNTIVAGDGDDTIGGDMVVGVDKIDGGAGTDLYLATSAGDTVTVDLGTGVISGGYRSGSTIANVENLTAWSPNAAVVFRGNASDNLLLGAMANDQLVGGAGSDTLSGLGGNDTLDGGAGADKLNGGAGADTFIFQSGEANGDTLVDFTKNQGDKLVFMNYGPGATFHKVGTDVTKWMVESADHSLHDTITVVNGVNFASTDYSFVTTTPWTATTALDATLGTVVAGTRNSDALSGTGGNEVFKGGPGADAMSGNYGVDYASYEGASSGLVASLTNPGSNTGDAFGDIYKRINNLIGSDFDDTLTGTSAVNTIYGGGGNDAIYGLSGSDVLHGGAGNDLLDGGDKSDTLYGGDGNDTLIGGAAHDVLNGGAGADTFVLSLMGSPGDSDTITDFTSGQDSLQINLKDYVSPAVFGATTFAAAGSAPDGQPHVLYDANNGALTWSADGSSRTLLATLQGHPALAAGDIHLA